MATLISTKINSDTLPPHAIDLNEKFPSYVGQTEKLKMQIDELQKLLSQEKEKVLTAKLEAKQKENLATEVENSLKEIRERYNREFRNKELDRERVDLKRQLKELTNKLSQERQIWVHMMQSQVKNTLPSAAKSFTSDSGLQNPALQKAETPHHIYQTKNYLLKKDKLTTELSHIKSTLSEMENQSTYVEKVSGSISALKQTISSFDADKLKKHYENVKILGQKFTSIEDQRAEETCIFNKVQRDKVRAIAELLKTRENLNKFKALNTALEREFNTIKQDKQKVSLELTKKNILLEKLKEDFLCHRKKYENKIDVLNKLCYEKNITAETLNKQLVKTQREYKARVNEFENIIKSQSASYSYKLNHIMQLKCDYESKIVQLEQEKVNLNTQCQNLSGQIKEKASENEKLVYENNNLSADTEKSKHKINELYLEKKRTESNIEILTRQNEMLIRQKNALDIMVKNLQQSRSDNENLIQNLQNKITEYEQNDKSAFYQKEIDSSRREIERLSRCLELEKNENVNTVNKFNEERENLKKELHDEKNRVAQEIAKISYDLEVEFKGQENAILNKISTELDAKENQLTRQKTKICELEAEFDKQKSEILNEMRTELTAKESQLQRQRTQILMLESEISRNKMQLAKEQQKISKETKMASLYKSLLKTQEEKNLTIYDDFKENRKIFEGSIRLAGEINSKLQNMLKKEQFHKAELKNKLKLFDTLSKSWTKRIKWAISFRFAK